MTNWPVSKRRFNFESLGSYYERYIFTQTKFTPNWEGPYLIEEIGGRGYCKLQSSDGKVTPSTNIKYVKKYYP